MKFLSILKKIQFRIIAPIIGALSLPFLAYMVLPKLGAQLTRSAYLLPATVGLLLGYIIGYLIDQQIKLIRKLKLEIQERTKGRGGPHS